MIVSDGQLKVVKMATQDSTQAQQPIARVWTEHEARSAPGVAVLAVGVVVTLAAIAVLVLNKKLTSGAGSTALVWVCVVALVAAGFAFAGLTPVVAGEGRAIQLFGGYKGTIRAPGLQWVNPFAVRRKISVRVRNLETSMAKVNDADGNPIEIAAVVVWQVQDTAKAIYGV